MLDKLNLQTSVLILFGIFMTLGVLVFAGIIPSPKSSRDQISGSTVSVWGTIPKMGMYELYDMINDAGKDVNINYSEHPIESFDADLTEALSAGKGPDIVLLPDQYIVRYQSKIAPMPYTSFSERAFRDTFIEEGEMYLRPDGILGFPVAVDPMVMYWNRDMFADKGVVRPPSYWDEFLTLATVLTERDKENNILKSAVSFGEYSNVAHAKDIIALLILQTGYKMLLFDGTEFSLDFSREDQQNGSGQPLIEGVFRFYTDFTDPLKSVYSWNRSIKNSKDAFLAQDLAIYFGYASELMDIQKKNPNLNFDTALVPQIRDYPHKISFARVQAASVLKSSQKKAAAFYLANLLSSRPIAKRLADLLLLPPVRRDLLAIKPTDAYKSVFYDSAIIGKSWIDPNPLKTEEVFRTAVESIVSGKADIFGAVSRMSTEIAHLAGIK